MKNKKININTETNQITRSAENMGISSENLQGKIIFTPKPFIDGVCRMYIEVQATEETAEPSDTNVGTIEESEAE